MSAPIREAIADINRRIEKLQETRDNLAELLSGDTNSAPRGRAAAAPRAGTGQRRQMSPEAKQRIKEAQERRWAAVRAQSANTPEAAPAIAGELVAQAVEEGPTPEEQLAAAAGEPLPAPVGKGKKKKTGQAASH